MAKYQITAKFALRTEIEPEFSPLGQWDAEELKDESSFRRQDVESRGGEIHFVVEADDEDQAEDVAREVIFDGQEIEDNYQYTWEVDSVEFEVEEVEPSMDIDEALSVLSAFAESARDESDEGLRRAGFAANIVIGDRMALLQRVDQLVRRVDEQGEQIAALSRRLQEVTDAVCPTPSEQ